MKKPSIGPVFPYYGAKWRSAGHYPAPLFGTVVEPFCGGGGYSLMHRRRSLLFDSSPHVAAAWRFVLGSMPESIRALKAPVKSVDEVPEEARALVGFWLNPGSAQPKRKASSRANPEAPVYFAGSVWSEKTRDRLAEEIPALLAMGLSFEQRDWRDIVVPTEPATFFVDPPYAVAGKYYIQKWSQGDYEELGAWCWNLASAGHQVIVCENAGAEWMPFAPLHRYHGSRRDSEEVVWNSHAEAA